MKHSPAPSESLLSALNCTALLSAAMKSLLLFLALLVSPGMLRAAEIPRRLVAIDNVCAWPNLVLLNDGSLVAIVFNQPNHGRTEGDVDCWGSADGLSWKWLSTVTRHEPQTNRMNHAAGLNGSGDLVVLCNGWDKVAPERNAASRPIQTVACLSHDGGHTWEECGAVLPMEEGMSWQ